MIINFDEDTLQRLDAAIRHWLENAAGNFEGIGSKQCALCERFIYQKHIDPIQPGQDCVGCPIHTCTGQPYCRNTPYPQAHDTYFAFGPSSEEFQKAAAQMHDLLVHIRGAHGMDVSNNQSTPHEP